MESTGRDPSFDMVEECGIPYFTTESNEIIDSGRIAYDNSAGYLYLDQIDPVKTLMRVGDWFHGLEVARWDAGAQTWRDESHDPQIQSIICKTIARHPVDEFLDTVPGHILDKVTAFKWRRFKLLQLLNFFPQWAEMIQSNPMLSLLAADAIYCKAGDPRHFVGLVFKKRKEIAAFCGMPGTDAMVNLLSKIRLHEYGVLDVLMVKEMVKYPIIIEFFGKFTPLDPKALLTLLAHSHILHYPFVHDVLFCKINKDVADCMIHTIDTRDWLKDIATMCGLLGIQDAQETLMKCMTKNDMIAFHDSLLPEVKRIAPELVKGEHLKTEEAYIFPAPPIPGSEAIQPITAWSDLQEEGETMNNCVGIYDQNVMSGLSYIYRVLSPERATLEIITDETKWYLHQLRLAHNKEPSPETREAVEIWLQDTGKRALG